MLIYPLLNDGDAQAQALLVIVYRSAVWRRPDALAVDIGDYFATATYGAHHDDEDLSDNYADAAELQLTLMELPRDTGIDRQPL